MAPNQSRQLDPREQAEAVVKLDKLCKDVAGAPVCTHYVGCFQRHITEAEASELATQEGLGKVLWFSTAKEWGGKHQHIIVFEKGSPAQDKKTVNFKGLVLEFEVEVGGAIVYMLTATESIDATSKLLLSSLPELSPEDREKLYTAVRTLLMEGKIAVDKRVGVTKMLMDKLTNLGLQEGAKRLLPKLAPVFADIFIHCTEEEVNKAIEHGMLTAVTCVIVIRNMTKSLRTLFTIRGEFAKKVAKFLEPVLKFLRFIANQTKTTADLLKRADENPSQRERCLAQAMTSVNVIIQYVDRLLASLPGIQKEIADYCKALDDIKSDEKDRALASLFLGIAELGFAIPSLAKGWKALSTMEKVTTACSLARAGALGLECGLATTTYFTLDSYFSCAKEHLEFYQKAEECLKNYREGTLDIVTPENIIVLEEQFRTHHAEIEEVIEMGTKLKKAK